MSAEYAIEIAASMPAGEATIAQLDALGEALLGNAAKSTKFYEQIQVLTASMDQAKAATAAANASLAEGNAMYRELEKAANVAAKAVEKAGAKGVIDPAASKASADADAALAAYSETLKGLEAAASGAAAQEGQLATQLQRVKAASAAADKAAQDQAKASEAAAKATASEAAKRAASVEAAKREADQLAKANEAAGVKAGKAARELTGLGKIDKLQEAFSSTSGAATVLAGATVALAAAVAAVVIAVTAATVAFVAWAVGLADTARSARLGQEAIEAMNPAIAEAAPLFSAITKETGQTTAELNSLVKSLKAAKVSAEDMPGALRAAALAEAALGKGGSADFLAEIKAGKIAVSELSAEVSGKLGPIVAKQMRGLDAQASTFKKNIGQLFGGLNIEPVLAGLERLGALFDENTAAGQTIKFLFESVFQPLIDQADKAAIVLEAFALGFLIGMTKLYIALKPVIKTIKEFLGFDDTTTADTLDAVKVAGEFVASLFVAFIGVLGALGVAVAATAAIFALPTIALYALVAALGYAASYLGGVFMSAWQSVTEFISGIDLVETGKNILLGLANGLVSAGPAVLKAIIGVVTDAIGSAKKLLGIASPSKVFAEIGVNTGEGFAGGVEDTADTAQAAMSDMVDPAPAAATAKEGATSSPGGGSSGPTVHIENLYLNGSKASEADTLSLAEALTQLIQGDAAALGAGVPE